MKTLRPYQRDALNNLKNGNVLVGGTGAGKSLVGLAYYYERILKGSMIDPFIDLEENIPLYIITTAKKETIKTGKEKHPILK